MSERFIVKRPKHSAGEMPPPDEIVLKLIAQEDTVEHLDAILGEVKAQREITELLSYVQLPPPSARMFPNPYQYKEVGVGVSAVLYDLDIPSEYLGGVITHLGNSWFANTYFTLDVDHRPVIEPKIQRQIAPVTEPTERHRFIVRKNIKWTVHNDDTESHNFEILCNGFYIPRTTTKQLR